MSLRSLVTFTLFNISINCFSQDSLRNVVFFEFFGNALNYSLNYERQFNHQWTARTGVSYFSDDLSIPLTFGKYFGKQKHHFEITSGVTYRNEAYGYWPAQGFNDPERIRVHMVYLTGFIGYRFQKNDGKFLFRTGATPLYEIYDGLYKGHGPRDLHLSIALSFGYRF